LANVKNAGTPRDRSRRSRGTGTGIGNDAGGRAQIIDAAITSIQEVGFYRSSTNEIARRADVSWGALQYHFGTREALLLAIIHEIDRRFLTDVEDAHVEGEVRGAITRRTDCSPVTIIAPTWLVRLRSS
jgi:AcrR family transcriptional regulator